MKRKIAWILTLLLSVFIVTQPVAAQFFLDYTENNIQTYEPRDCAPGTSNTNLVGSDNQQKAFNFFIQKGLTPVQSAAIIGNLMQESGVNPKVVNPSSGAFGIAQWLGTRKKGLDNFAREDQTTPARTINDFSLQLDWLWYEISEGYEQASLKALKNETVLATDTTAGTGGAVEVFERKFERAGEHEKAYEKRYKYAKDALGLYGNSSEGEESTPSATTSTGFCECEEGKVVLIDPGHSKNKVEEYDPDSGIKTVTYENVPEMQQVWDASQKAAEILEEKGYRVLMTKTNVNEDVGLIRRAQIANEVKADIAVSIHNDNGQSFDSFKWVTPQETGKFRETGGNRKTFTDADIANKSKEYADKMVATRKESEGGNVIIHGLDFPKSRGLTSWGNISITQLFAKVPWVYHEVGGKGWTEEKGNQYGEGIANGIDSALGGSGAAGTDPSCSLGNGNASAMAVNYAWPDYRGAGYDYQKPEYKDAVKSALSAGRFVGGCDGNDCGGFVTRVMQDSRADPDYNNTSEYKSSVRHGQAPYIRSKPDKYELIPNVTGPSQLEPYGFAIAIENDESHTFMYVGDQPGFESDRASASYSSNCSRSRPPMAGREPFRGNRWYVLKK